MDSNPYELLYEKMISNLHENVVNLPDKNKIKKALCAELRKKPWMTQDDMEIFIEDQIEDQLERNPSVLVSCSNCNGPLSNHNFCQCCGKEVHASYRLKGQFK